MMMNFISVGLTITNRLIVHILYCASLINIKYIITGVVV